MRNPFKKRVPYVDPHDLGNDVTNAALAVFEEVKTELGKANAHFDAAITRSKDRIAEAQTTIQRHTARIEAAAQAQAKNSSIAKKIEGLLS